MAGNKYHWTVLLLSLLMFLAPALGSPTEELLQDTLKSILVSLFVLSASMVYVLGQRKQAETFVTHKLLWLPIGLMAYALGSMLWSHTYLGGVEAIRWFIFSLILFIGMNTLSHARTTHLAWGIHLGAVTASLWAALQFWSDFKLFSQGAVPASTFVNRNFFAEYLVCSLPYSVLLLTRLKDKISVFTLIFSLAFNVVALMMTGTRSALSGLVLLAVLLPFIIGLYRRQVISSGWRAWHCAALTILFIGSTIAMGSIDARNPTVIGESGTGDAIDRAIKRSLSVTNASEYTEGSFSIRAQMWRATLGMIAANPLSGVGAGAWEVQIPIYQEKDSQLEIDYYAHNEILQLLAEYGIVGWVFLLCLMFYLIWAAIKTLTNRNQPAQNEAPLRAFVLSSLLVFLLVSNAGFPWRMATTGAIFALSLAVLAASDARVGNGGNFLLTTFRWNSIHSSISFLVLLPSIALAIYICQQAIVCESKIVLAVKSALTISNSGNPNDPRWAKIKQEILEDIRDGVAINPHYRKLTPIVADSLAGWGDWENAIWVWESILKSRPNVVAMLANVTRGNMQLGKFQEAQATLAQAKSIQPNAPAVEALEVMLLIRTDKKAAAAKQAKKLLRAGTSDFDLVRSAYFLGMEIRDVELATLALKIRIKNWPNQAVDAWLKLGNIYAAPEVNDKENATRSFQAAITAAGSEHKESVMAMIPAIYKQRMQ